MAINAEQYLIDLLSGEGAINPRPVKDIFALGGAAGFAKSELKEARKRAGITSFSTVTGTQMWFLEDGESA